MTNLASNFARDSCRTNFKLIQFISYTLNQPLLLERIQKAEA